MNKAPNPNSVESTMHMVNAALLQTGAACDTWHQVVEWADLTLRIHRKYQALRGEEISETQMQGEASKA